MRSIWGVNFEKMVKRRKNNMPDQKFDSQTHNARNLERGITEELNKFKKDIFEISKLKEISISSTILSSY